MSDSVSSDPLTAVPPMHARSVSTTVLDVEGSVLLAAVLDCIIPPHAELGGAGTIGIGEFVIASFNQRPFERRLLLDLLRAIEVASGRVRVPRIVERLDEALPGFLTLTDEEQDTVLRTVEQTQLVAFDRLVNFAYRGYYTDARVLRHLEATVGYPARPPAPLGHAMEPWDPTVLDRQRQRAPFWRSD